MKQLFTVLAFLLIPIVVVGQLDTIESKLSFNADFRFRVEQDWDSRKSDGTYRDDRTRFRYRARAGITYKDNWFDVGLRLRTGDQRKQQDPQLTLGDGFEEFGTLPIGFEKAYFQGHWTRIFFWLGKNDFPFEKSNELFWSDNVYPEGIAVGKVFDFDSGFINALDLRAGHFIISTSGKSLKDDAYFQGYQFLSSFFNNKIEVFPALYLFNDIPNIPDGGATFVFDYSILHIGTRLNLLKRDKLKVEFDFYENLEDYSQNDSIPNNLKEEKSGMVIALKYGNLRMTKDWQFTATYSQLQQYSAVDFLAQNDWARWDYSSFDSPDGRLTNYKGVEFTVGYKIDERMILKAKCYFVEQLIPYGIAKETGSRIRFDIDYKF
ncbi:MAG: hypothetical protein HKO72_05260 [Flavobacteriaceae bacterium]|nr:putative porin [Bacteroidia bacterium]NNL60730.1 hypothetical protein [Flavobacteriaceae bacterium]